MGFSHEIIFLGRRRHLHLSTFNVFFSDFLSLSLHFGYAADCTPRTVKGERIVLSELSRRLLPPLWSNAQGGAALSLWNDVHMSQPPLWRNAQGGAALSLWNDVHMSQPPLWRNAQGGAALSLWSDVHMSQPPLWRNAQGGAALSLWSHVHMSQPPLWRKAQGGAALSLWSDVHMSDLGDRSCLCDQTDVV
jgi:hypothetical protein